MNRLIGNKEIKETLKAINESGRFPHAFIIEGEEGSGRKTLAKIIAAMALCRSENKPCDACRECRLVFEDGHCDCLTYAPEGATFKVDLVREIRDNAFVMPTESERKVNILCDCDKMQEPAQNAFLKVLEEPPEFMIFLLLCKNASALLPTVRSRCVTLTLHNPEPADAAEYIENVTGKPKNDIIEALEYSRGNIGRALEYLSGSSADAAENAKQFFEAIKKRNRLDALSVVYKYERDRHGFVLFLSEIRLMAQQKAREVSLGQSDMTAATTGRVLSAVTETEARFLKHVGQPLSVPLTATTLCAEIFSALN